MRALICLFLVPLACAQYTVSTVAGGSFPQKASAMSVSITPRAIAIGSNGTLYVADQTTIYKLDGSGNMSIYAFPFAGIAGLACDAAGNVYVSETNNNRVQQVTPSGVVHTFAGGGGLTGDGIAATKAQLGGASGIAVDAQGNVYIAESYGQRIRKVNASTGNIETVAGSGTAGYAGDGGPALQAEFNGPSALASDAAGNLYVYETFGYHVRRIDAALKTVATIAGTGSPGFSGDGGTPTSAAFSGTVGALFVDNSGVLYVADTGNAAIRKISADLSTISSIAGTASPGFAGDGGPAAQAQLNAPNGVAVDASGDIFIADTANDRIREIASADGSIFTIAGGGTAGDGGPAIVAQLNHPSALAVDAAGGLYVNDCGNARIRRVGLATGTITAFAGTGFPGFSGDGGAATQAALQGCGGLAAVNGSLYIADADNFRVREVSSGGAISTVAGNGTPGPSTSVVAGAAQFHPTGIAVDQASNVYIADAAANVVLKFDAGSNTVAPIAGTGSYGFSGDGGPAVNAILSSPNSVAVDVAGNVYVADTANHRIRRIDALSRKIATIAGTGNYAHSGDGGPAVSADIAFPMSLTFDASGNLYFLESTLGNVRQISPSGQINTIWSGFSVPAGLAADPAGNLYVSEPQLNRIRKLAVSSGPLQIASTSPLPEAFVAVSYLATITASGGKAPYQKWTVESGALPPGLALNASTGVVSGTPMASGLFQLTIAVSDSQGARVNKSFKLSVAAPGFTISAQGVIHGAMLASGPVAAGEIVAIFGNGFGPSKLSVAQPDGSGFYPTTLGGVEVFFDNVPAPLLYVSPTQIGAVVPYEVAGQTSTTMQVESNGGFSNTATLTVTQFRPALFTSDASGAGQVLAINEDGTVNSVANPARPGSIVLLYGTGFGVLTPATPDGKLSMPPLSAPTAPLIVSVGGAVANILYAGAAPSMISGVVQLNVEIPLNANTGSQPVTFTMGGVAGTQSIFIVIE